MKKSFYVGLIIIGTLVVACLILPFILQRQPSQMLLSERLLSPQRGFLLGTDQLGRCQLTRLLYGGRLSLSVTALVVVVSAIFGTAVGLISALIGGRTDRFIQWLINILLAFPGLVLSLGIAGILGPSLRNALIAVVSIQWIVYARTTRVLVLSLKEKEFVKVAPFCGTSQLGVVTQHLLPNLRASLMVLMAMDMGSVLLRIATLSFLGIGVQAPTPEWGAMIHEGRGYMQTAPWLIVYPGIAIFLMVFSMNLISDGLRDYYDVRRI